MKYAVITENDQSSWHDVTGSIYHFPKRYLKFLPSGTMVVYYKGKLRNPIYSNQRLSEGPHYFGTARIGKVYKDRESSKGDYYAEILNFRRFAKAVPIREGNSTFEVIPSNRMTNYWRDGVRPITRSIYDAIVARGSIESMSKHGEKEKSEQKNDTEQGLPAGLESYVEGERKRRFVTTYERDPRLRRLAIGIHGLKCTACGFNFHSTYGPHGAGFIHVHHLEPVSGLGGRTEINPKSDMTVLCANCHSMVHRFKDKTLSVEQLKRLMMTAKMLKSSAQPAAK